jgi:hypothetical protein
MQRAKDRVAVDLAFGKRPALMAAGVVDGVKFPVSGVKNRDRTTPYFHGFAACRRDFFY